MIKAPTAHWAPLLVVNVVQRDTKVSAEAHTHSVAPIREDFLCLLLTMFFLAFGSAGVRLVISQGP